MNTNIEPKSEYKDGILTRDGVMEVVLYKPVPNTNNVIYIDYSGKTRTCESKFVKPRETKK